MIREFILFIKYPYTAGVIATIWLGTALLMAINKDLPGIKMVSIDVICTTVIAGFGFAGKKEM